MILYNYNGEPPTIVIFGNYLGPCITSMEESGKKGSF